MFWIRVKEFSRSLSLRLSLGYATIFTGSALLLFILIYYLLSAAINQKDQDLVDSRLREYQTIYEVGGVQALQTWIDSVGEAQRQKTFFIRVVKPDQTVLFLILPVDWVRSDLQRVDEGEQDHPESWMRVPRDENVDLTVASTHLQDGTFIEVGRSSDSRDQLLGKFRAVFALVTMPVILLGFIGGIGMTNRTIRPFRQMVRAVRSITNTGKMDVRVPASKTTGELEDLVQLFNRMLDGNEKLIHALRGSLDNVSHDLRTPLSRLRVTLEEVLRTNPDLDTTRQAVAEALEETDLVETIIRTLMDVTLAETGMMKLNIVPTDLSSLVTDVLELYEEVTSEKEITIETRFDGNYQTAVDPTRIRQVFANLLDNALKYTPNGGKITLSTQRRDGQAEIIFRDNGMGITANDLPHIWDRLYRGDKSRSEHGLGLGLSLVKAITEAHGGRVEVKSTPKEGAEFRVILPTSL